MAKVSVLMNCYNSEKFLKESVDSVIKQTFTDWEIIFWDNQSTDNSANIVLSYKDERIKYFYAPTHTSLYAGRNAALKHCSGEFLAILDCDDVWLPNKLMKQVAVFDTNPNVVLVHSNTLFFNSDTARSWVLRNKPALSGYIFGENLIRYQFSLETVMVRMETVKTNNLNFHKKFNMIGDRDFLSMLCFYGDVFYIHEVLAKWRLHDNNFSKKLKVQHVSELKIMYLHFSRKFKFEFTRKMRLSLYNEIVIREAYLLFSQSGEAVRKKLRKISFLNFKALVLFALSFLPKKISFKIFQLISRV